MHIIPAIDLQNGRCVRLLRGDFAQETVYGEDPLAVAQRWRDGGAALLHVVDLDGTRAGHPVQTEIIRSIAQIVPVQVGGGLRTIEDLTRTVNAGASRVVVGTAALDLPLVDEMVRTFGDALVVALDTRGGEVSVQGWTAGSGRALLDLARALIDVGVARFLHTDVERDGALTSPNFRSLEALIALGRPVIASGGVAGIEHIRRLARIDAEGVIVGRALYEGTVDLEEALAVAGETHHSLS